MRLTGSSNSITCASQSQARVPLFSSRTLVYAYCDRIYHNARKCHTYLARRRPGLYTIFSGGGGGSGRTKCRRPSAVAASSASTTTSNRELEISSTTSGDKFIGTSDHLGAAALSTLHVLEWERLCHHVASFASTTLGQGMCATLYPATNPAICERLLAETRAVDALESEFASDVDFGGIQTRQAHEAILRASRGGMLTGRRLVSVASLLVGAAKLQKAIQYTAKDAEFTGLGDTSVLSPVLEIFRHVVTHPELSSEIGFAIKDDGHVREAASDEVKKAAGKVRTIEGRIRGILKGLGGEITEYGGRMCCSIAASIDGPPRGILLGSGPGGTSWYVEPAAAVPLNNELTGAKGELTTAEEAVLWKLTGKVGDLEADLEHALHAVVWLDSVAARARYGRWIGGTLPRLIPFPKTGKARGGSAKRKKQQQQQQEQEESLKISTGNEEGDEEEEDVEPSKYIVYLRKLKHPLLLGEYLLARQNGGSSGGRAAGAAAGEKTEQRLPGWRPPSSSNRKTSSGISSSSDSDEDQDSLGENSSSSSFSAPVPVDIFIPSSTRAVIITGPNTGGKTASMKALGLASLAARAGLPIPAAGPALLPCFDSVLADIGDEQSLTASLSTFSGHLRRIEALRSESTGKSLVLLDELGTGTDPTEGAALGIALIKVLARGGVAGAALTMATTHHSELTALKYSEESDVKIIAEGSDKNANTSSANKTSPAASAAAAGPKFENASVEFDEIKLAPTYKLLWGVPGRSNALNIAERLGLDAEVVEAARERLGVAAAAVNDSIVVLEEARKTQDRDEAAAVEMEERARAARTKAATLR
uniref:DNA mismatch repair protein Mut2-like protein n=1 Tax=Nannochloris bacillaris TaxID=76111 RepID=Q68BK7_NANBA|nr:DNA mismatch repair protein Mut2-like protein [Nannochloris bacillaris]